MLCLLNGGGDLEWLRRPYGGENLIRRRGGRFLVESLDTGDLHVGWVISCLGDVSGSCGEVFSRGVGFIVGEGSRVQFWLDDWMGMGSLSVLFPRVFRVASNKALVVKDCYVV